MTDKKRYPKNSLRNPTQKKLRAVFGDLEIVDATEPLVVFPSKEDFAGATRLDPHNCGFARCAARSIGATSALVFATTAFFDHVGKDGERRIHRYKHSRATKHIVHEFDAGHNIDVSKAFVFRPPAECLTLDYQRAKGRRLRKSPRGKSILAEWVVREKLKQAEADLERWKTVAAKHPKPTRNGEAARQQVTQLKERVRKLQEEFDEKHAKAKEARLRPYQPKRTESHTSHNLRIRNGTGFMSR